MAKKVRRNTIPKISVKQQRKIIAEWNTIMVASCDLPKIEVISAKDLFNQRNTEPQKIGKAKPLK